MPSKEYLESALNEAKKLLPDRAWKTIHQTALPVAGGKARWREPEEPSFLEKMALAEMRPDKLKDAPDEEVLNAWRRLHMWYSVAKKRKDPIEEIINASVWVMEEFDRRGFDYDENSELVQEAKKLRDVKKAQSIEAKLAELPEEVVVVPNFVCVVGSSATGKEKPEDVDVLFRANRDESGDNFLVQAQNVWLPVRKVLDPEKKGLLHYIDGPTGPHSDNIPVFDLVLRRKAEFKRQVVKEGLSKPIRSPGGKDAWLDVLLNKIPPHKVYVEPYAGGASLFWAKEPSEKEVLADINPDIVAFYKFLQNASDGDFAWMRELKWDWSSSHFEEVKNSSPKTLREKAYRCKYLNLSSIRGKGEVIDPTEPAKGLSGRSF
ncbi:MAG: DNA adenine methylase, partial [Deltaproteobacteria bacterium]|nr:DNA adenine methylase [Deltaproteobacteria bacterium]